MSKENHASTLGSWGHLSTSMSANGDQFKNLEAERAQLETLHTQASELVLQHAALRASKQDVAKRLQTILQEGRKLATFLRVGVKQKLGNRSEKIVEYGLQPFRSRPRKAKTPTPTPNPTPTPTPTSTSTSTPAPHAKAADSPTPTTHPE